MAKQRPVKCPYCGQMIDRDYEFDWKKLVIVIGMMNVMPRAKRKKNKIKIGCKNNEKQL